MAFKNPWGKGSKEHDKWFKNDWSKNQWGKGGKFDSGWGAKEQGNSKDGLLSDQVLTVQTSSDPDPEWLRYKVKSGEGFDIIAKKFGIDSGEYLAIMNNLEYNNPNELHSGDELALPYITEETLDEITADLEEMKAKAREKGWLVAVDNLNKFQDGTNGIKIMDATWLKGFECVVEAITDIQEHFADAFSSIADDMDDPSTVKGDGTKKKEGSQYWWQGFIDPPYASPEEISMACGASTLDGVGVIQLVRNGDEVSVSGEVEFQFDDPYDWTPGDTVPIGFSWGQALVFPLMGAPLEEWPDSNMILLEEFRKAAEFQMKSTWKQRVSGSITVNTFSNDINLKWEDI